MTDPTLFDDSLKPSLPPATAPAARTISVRKARANAAWRFTNSPGNSRRQPQCFCSVGRERGQLLSARDRRNAAPQRRQGVTFAGSGQIGADNFWHCRHGLVG